MYYNILTKFSSQIKGLAMINVYEKSYNWHDNLITGIDQDNDNT